MEPEELNPIAVNKTGYSGFGFFNSVSQTSSLAHSLQTLEIRTAPLPPTPSSQESRDAPFPKTFFVHFLSLEARELESLSMGS